MNVRVMLESIATMSAFFAPAAAEADAPPTTSVSAEIAAKDRGLVRSNTLAPAPRMPGRFAAVVPVSKLPVEPNSASDPLDAASRPHFVAPLGDDLSSQMSISSGRPSWQVPLTAFSATFGAVLRALRPRSRPRAGPTG